MRFFAYLVAALQSIDEAIGPSVQSLLGSTQLPPAAPALAQRSAAPWVESLMTALIGDITTTSAAFTLVLDDYHVISRASVHATLQFLLEHQPPQIHLVVVTREDPPLPLPRLRVRGELNEIRERDLRFTVEEAAAFLSRTMGLALPAEAVAALETRTEGWIAGLQLAAISLQGHKDATSLIKSFTGSHRFVLDYLIEEVLQQQSVAVQTFLLQTAVLDRLTGSLCDAVRFGTAKTPQFGSTETPIRSKGTYAVL